MKENGITVRITVTKAGILKLKIYSHGSGLSLCETIGAFEIAKRDILNQLAPDHVNEIKFTKNQGA